VGWEDSGTWLLSLTSLDDVTTVHGDVDDGYKVDVVLSSAVVRGL